MVCQVKSIPHDIILNHIFEIVKIAEVPRIRYFQINVAHSHVIYSAGELVSYFLSPVFNFKKCLHTISYL